MLRKFLKVIWVLQVRDVKGKHKAISEKRRLNPYNPLTYIFMIVIVIIAIVLYGIVGAWAQLDLEKPFTWRKS
jgi:hypothetical protein